jgi:hypothetical protein
MFNAFADSPRRARAALALLWIGGFLMGLGIVMYVYLRGWVERDSFLAAAKRVSDLYAPYVGVILLFYWSTRADTLQLTSARARTGVVLALLVSGLWNVLLLAFLTPLAFGNGSLTEAVDSASQLGGMLSWLVGGAIGFFFGTAVADSATAHAEQTI